MNRNEAIFILTKIEEACKENHLDSEAIAVRMGIYALGIEEQRRTEREKGGKEC